MTSNFKHEFPDFDYDVAALIAELPAGWEDRSWHNDAMPKACPDLYGYATLWFDYADAALSEFPEGREAGTMKRFCLNDREGAPLFETDEWPEMREWIAANTALITKVIFESTSDDIAKEFSQRLRQQLLPREWKEMIGKNASDPRYASGACASQDYLDANMTMAEAFEDVTGHAADGNSENDAALWNRAWAKARELWNEEAAQ